MSVLNGYLASQATLNVPQSWVDGDEIASLPQSVLPDQQHYAPEAESAVNESASQQIKSAAEPKEVPQEMSAPTGKASHQETKNADEADKTEEVMQNCSIEQLFKFLKRPIGEKKLETGFMTPTEALNSLKAIGIGHAVEILFILLPNSVVPTTGKFIKTTAFIYDADFDPVTHREVDFVLHIYETSEEIKKEHIFSALIETYGYITIPRACTQLGVFGVCKTTVTAEMLEAQRRFSIKRTARTVMDLDVFKFCTYHVLRHLPIHQREDYLKGQWKKTMNARGLRFVTHFTWDMLWNITLDSITEVMKANKDQMCEETASWGQQFLISYILNTAYQATGGATGTPSAIPASLEEFVAKMQKDVKAAKEAKRAAMAQASDHKEQDLRMAPPTRKRRRQDDSNWNDYPPASSPQNDYRRRDTMGSPHPAMPSPRPRRRRPRRARFERSSGAPQQQQFPRHWSRAPY